MKTLITQEFITRFGEDPTYIVRAPGRVNLIGEHTDYNDGFVLPMTIDRAIWIALRPRSDRRILLHSLDFEQPADFSFDNFTHQSGWAEYVRGIAWVLQEQGFNISGWEGVLTGNVPLGAGAGLSSSAALELALLKAFWTISDFNWDGAICLSS
jgi:galactokinase